MNETNNSIGMKKNIVLMCDCGLQFGVLVDELSVAKIMKQIVNDVWINPKPCICFADYIPSKDPNQTMYVKTASVVSIRVENIQSGVQVPNKQLFVPGVVGRPN
ncbi:hypothetical protein LCGC14_0849280 [marine sediment metagenome]|uniref:Uncharacterized protein n=1 Tax=marine sediment metagenome TaxID=412755 RepID=A0A0F9PAT7_9ZZZZ